MLSLDLDLHVLPSSNLVERVILGVVVNNALPISRILRIVDANLHVGVVSTMKYAEVVVKREVVDVRRLA